MKNKEAGFSSIDEYIATFPEATQKILQEVRAMVKAAAPEAREKISNQIAAFELNGRNLAHFAGWKNHVGMYPIPSGTEVPERSVAIYGRKGHTKIPNRQTITAGIDKQNR